MQFPSLDRKVDIWNANLGSPRVRVKKSHLCSQVLCSSFCWLWFGTMFWCFLSPQWTATHKCKPPTRLGCSVCLGNKGLHWVTTTRVSRSRQSATQTGQIFWYLPSILTHTKWKRTFFLLLATMLRAMKEKKKKNHWFLSFETGIKLF